MASPDPQERIGQYVLLREIGRGAMATVYEAEHTALAKRVALKRMHAHLAADETAASRFLLEGKAATQIRSRNVVEVYDVGSHQGVPYLVMELLEGADLAAVLRERKKLGLQELADVIVPVTVAVQAAHEAGVIHRDLKPSNIVLAEDESGACSPIILDFGISKITTETERDLTASEVLLGTVHYMSPEQTRSGRDASARSDQYALGVLLYECATGVKPFKGSTPYAVMHAIVSARVQPPSALDPALPDAFDHVVVRAMHRDPTKRFASVLALGAAMLRWASAATKERFAASLGVDPASLEAAAQRPGRWRWIAGVAAVTGMLAAVGGAVVVGRGSRPASAQPPVAPAGGAASLVEEEGATRRPPISPSTSTSTSTPTSTPTSIPTAASPTRVTTVRSASPGPSGSASQPPGLQHGTNGALIVE